MEKENNGSGKKSFFEIVNKRVLFMSGGALVFFVAFGAIATEQFANGANAALGFVTKYFSWFITPISFFTVIFCLWAAFSKFGKIRLGGPDAKPTMSKPVWFAITLTSGIAVGINYYCVYEPVWLAQNPPPFLGIEPMSSEAIYASMKYTFLHWGLHPYAISLLAKEISPKLTALAQPLDEIGKKSVEILLDQINNNAEPRMYELESRVIARESTIRFVSAPQ